jgi:excinuclease ABC subunit A
VCHGRRFTEAVCRIHFQGKSVADVLQMRVDESVEFFQAFSRLHSVLAAFQNVGLGYLTLGQPATTFSGGELQRAKLASEFAMPAHEHTLYVLDEPTRGLHPVDVQKLVGHLRQLVTHGHSVVVIEHNQEVVLSSDWTIDIGPDAAADGGQIVFQGHPEHLRQCETSETGRALRSV